MIVAFLELMLEIVILTGGEGAGEINENLSLGYDTTVLLTRMHMHSKG